MAAPVDLYLTTVIFMVIPFFHPSCSLSPKRGFPDQLVASYGKLCFSCLVSMEMPHPLSSLDHHVVSICAELTNQILSRSHSITQATVHEFQNLLVGKSIPNSIFCISLTNFTSSYTFFNLNNVRIYHLYACRSGELPTKGND